MLDSSRSFLKFRLILVVFSFFSQVSCKHNSASRSESKHTFGETYRSSENVLKCIREDKNSPYQEAENYLTDLAKYIAMKNSNTFREIFAIENICFYVVEDSQLNAWATLNRNQIVFSSKILNMAGSDADVASVLTHELAHLTMQSQHVDEVPPEVIKHPEWLKVRSDFESEQAKSRVKEEPFRRVQYKAQDELTVIEKELSKLFNNELRAEAKELSRLHRDLKAPSLYEYYAMETPSVSVLPGEYNNRNAPVAMNTTDFQSFKTRRESFLNKLRSTNQELTERWEQQHKVKCDAFIQMRHIDDELASKQRDFDGFIKRVAGEGAKYNWKEQQADEVGYELFLRAGFNSENITWLQKSLMSADKYSKCLDDHVKLGIAPTRGQGTHPSLCWRVFDYLVLEANFHKNDYERLMTEAKIVHLPDLKGRLDKVKVLLNSK